MTAHAAEHEPLLLAASSSLSAGSCEQESGWNGTCSLWQWPFRELWRCPRAQPQCAVLSRAGLLWAQGLQLEGCQDRRASGARLGPTVLPGPAPCTVAVVQVLCVTAFRSASQVQYCFLSARIYKEHSLESQGPLCSRCSPGVPARGYCTATAEAPWMDSMTAAKRLHRS